MQSSQENSNANMPAASSNRPIGVTQRIASLDVLRGFALLGILMVNIQSFGLIGAKYMNPLALGPLTGSSYWSWWTTHVFYDSKFMTIFSLLFGAGIVLMWEHSRDQSQSFGWLHYRRMFWLLLLGLAHAHLLWYGDILFLYAVCGAILYWLCGLRPTWLVLIGLLMLSIGSLNSILSGLSLPYWDEVQKNELLNDWQPSPERVESELEAYRGGWLQQMPNRTAAAIFMETFLVVFWGFWRAGGLMLIGMALYKWNVFAATRSLRFYTVGAIAGAIGGLSLIVFGVSQLEKHNWSFDYAFFLGSQYNYWGSPLLSFAYICLLMLLCRMELGTGLRDRLAAVGRMALSNYLLQTLLCTTLFYGHGFGWFGYRSRIELIGIVLVIWILQLSLSPIWLHRYRFGPMEWLWRCLSYFAWQPMKKGHARHQNSLDLTKP